MPVMFNNYNKFAKEQKQGTEAVIVLSFTALYCELPLVESEKHTFFCHKRKGKFKLTKRKMLREQNNYI